MNPSWRQINVRFDDWSTVEQTATTRLWPALTDVEEAGLIDAWFFIRKAEEPKHRGQNGLDVQDHLRAQPCWRVRVLPHNEALATDALAVLHKRLTSAAPVIYEPEIHAFGGPDGMAVAHTLFHQDSRHVLTYLSHLDATGPVVIGRRELAILLCSRLFRAAGQDWYEQGDIWARIAQDRRPSHELPPEKVRSLQPALRRLMTVDSAHLVRDRTSDLAFAASWFTAFDNAGQQLAQLARDGVLQRGLRAVLAHHVLFAFNRLGLGRYTQTLLANTATTVVFD